jgi:hypothetical protein
MGDAVWPEENFALVIWCEAEEAAGIKRAVANVKEHFPDEGVRLFSLGGEAADSVPATDSASRPSAPPLPNYVGENI